ncbi:hypothetical protein Ddye_027720 [Dipteronia dyeriana]|uniref:Cullin N-terminal domain-containing protein n=1 Tax=Dipteronia dyeriana TaxID=168575 RepID=A0AAD9TQL2_9ROSI|nr:hypothetical protein Ddye_027720 [Dipteronia dyeriana]
MFKDIPLEEGLMIMEEGIGKAKKIMQGCPETKFTFAEYQKYYECVYFMSICENGNEKSKQLYNLFKRSLEESIETMVVPSLVCQDDEACLLRQLVLMWSNYKSMASWLYQFFHYLDRFLRSFTVNSKLLHYDWFVDLLPFP